jgi:putative FmdB family regulatory protein
MPLYEYECKDCGQTRTDIRCIADRERGPKCDRCKPRRTMTQIISGPPMGIVKDPAAGPSKRGF